jgi:serine/threonine-protein kinase
MKTASAVPLPRYEDLRLVSEGAIADLYLGVDPLLHRPVAIKVLSERLAADPETGRRFIREALAAARLSGEEQVVTIYEVGEAAGRPFVVMEFLRGGSLEDVLRDEPVQSSATALRWLEEAARALDRAHEQGLVHGDLKPANLLFDETGHVHVTDFGLANVGESGSSEPTASSVETAVMSAPGYRAPEQVRGLADGAAADEYALAAIGFELLTGRLPLENDRSRNRLPIAAQRVFDRALARRPEDRYGSCSEFVAALQTALAGERSMTTAAAPTAVPARSAWRTRVLPVAGVLLLAVGGAVAAIAATRHGNDPNTTAAAGVTLTRPGTTVRETVTAEAPAVTVRETVTVRTPARTKPSEAVTVTVQAHANPATPTVSTAAAATPSGGQSSASLALAGYRRLQGGDAAGALPLLRSAAVSLDGTHTLAEAYNDYNLALAITKTTGCEAQVPQLLQESEAIQGHRPEIDRLRRACGPG